MLFLLTIIFYHAGSIFFSGRSGFVNC